jgi:hypothetical protein
MKYASISKNGAIDLLLQRIDEADELQQNLAALCCLR